MSTAVDSPSVAVPPRPLVRARRGVRRWVAAGVAAALLVALGAMPLAVSGWDPTGGPGTRVPAAADLPDDSVALTVAPGAQVELVAARWTGATAWPLTPASGEVAVAGWTGRLADEDPSADYYVIVLETSWSHDAGLARLPAPVLIRVTSDPPAVGNVYGATQTFVSDASCETMVPAPVSRLGGTGRAAACRGYGIELVGQDAAAATWSVEQPAGLRAAQLVVQQKVAEGTTPVWTVELDTPAGTASAVPWSTGASSRTTVSASLTP